MRLKFLLLLIVLLTAGAAAFAGTPPAAARTELAISGALTLPPSGKTTWNVVGEVLLPLGTEHLVAGPSVSAYDDSERTTAGAVIEWNLAGQRFSPFLGADGSCLVRDPDVGDRCALLARGGLKVPIGGGAAALKLYGERIVEGRGHEDPDTRVLAGILARF